MHTEIRGDNFVSACLMMTILLSCTGAPVLFRPKAIHALKIVLHGQEQQEGRGLGGQTEEDFGEAMHDRPAARCQQIWWALRGKVSSIVLRMIHEEEACWRACSVSLHQDCSVYNASCMMTEHATSLTSYWPSL